MGFVRYSSFPEMVVSQLRNITIEDSFENTITEEYWPPSKIKSGHKLNRIHLHISFDQPSSNPGRFLSALMGKKRKASSTIPGALVDKKIRKPNAFCVHGNAVSGVVIFVPEGLRLHITIKLLDGGLEFSHGSCTIQRSPFLDADPHGVYWSLETSDGWEFSVKEPDEVILSLNMCDTAAPQSYEVQYGLKQFTWESFGSMIVPVDKLRGVVQGLMRGLGYPESKINVILLVCIPCISLT